MNAIGLIGIGKMGYKLIGNLLDNGFDVYCHDLNEAACQEAAQFYSIPTFTSLTEFLAYQPQQRLLWVMLPAGKVTNELLATLNQGCMAGDIVIDGGNSNPEDSKQAAQIFAENGIAFLDVGTSGGTHGARFGASYMIGGDFEIFSAIEPLFCKTSKPNGYLYTGPSGSGHFLKIVHNAILYGFMQTLGEGFEILSASDYGYQLEEVAESWAQTSVIRGWLLELAADSFEEDPQLAHAQSVVDASQSTNWVLDFCLEQQVAVPAITAALFARFKSQSKNGFTERFISSMRNKVGGHPVTQGNKESNK